MSLVCFSVQHCTAPSPANFAAQHSSPDRS
jgi:hypothetical protein